MPSPDTPTRKLATIMFTDIAGFTSQMSKDEAVALSLLDTKRKFLKPLIKKYNGTFVKEMGDGTLSHFPTANDAVNCSLDFQKSIKDNNPVWFGCDVGKYFNRQLGVMDDNLFDFDLCICAAIENLLQMFGLCYCKSSLLRQSSLSLPLILWMPQPLGFHYPLDCPSLIASKGMV